MGERKGSYILGKEKGRAIGINEDGGVGLGWFEH